MAKATTIDLTGLKSIDESSTTFSNNGKWLIQKSEKYTSGDTKYLQRTVSMTRLRSLSSQVKSLLLNNAIGVFPFFSMIYGVGLDSLRLG